MLTKEYAVPNMFLSAVLHQPINWSPEIEEPFGHLKEPFKLLTKPSTGPKKKQHTSTSHPLTLLFVPSKILSLPKISTSLHLLQF